MLSDYARFFWTMATRRYDVVQVNPSFRIGALTRDGGFVLIAKAFRRRVVVFVHGWDMEFERKLRAKVLPLFRLVYFRAGMPRSDVLRSGMLEQPAGQGMERPSL